VRERDIRQPVRLEKVETEHPPTSTMVGVLNLGYRYNPYKAKNASL
jgi:hypothetical protein